MESTYKLTRIITAFLLVVAMVFSTIVFTGCGSSDASESSAAAAASSGSEDEQDNCYGDDLPATKNN